MFSASTDYLLAGMDIPNGKIKKAEEKKVRIINLKRLVQLLTGKLPSFEEMHGLPPLSKVDFTDKKYERRVIEPATQSIEEDSADADSGPSPQSADNASGTDNSSHHHPPQIMPAPTDQHQEASADRS